MGFEGGVRRAQGRGIAVGSSAVGGCHFYAPDVVVGLHCLVGPVKRKPEPRKTKTKLILKN
jgi:hypothetical protein